MVRFLCIVFMSCPWQASFAQTNCFAKVETNLHSVYVQQPLRVTITVMTSTWFTAPLVFNNLQVPDAFTVPFTAAAPGQFEHNGQQYAGVQFYFIVFPYKPGSYNIPSLEITATTPPAGSSVSEKVTVRTPPQAYVVKPVPHEFPADVAWMVAKNVVLHERWNHPLDSLKVGDVLENTVMIDAMGTVPQFIPPVKSEKVSWANIYPQTPQLTDTRDENDANGERLERNTWLLLKPGHFEIPGTTVYWWNPFVGRLYKQSTPARKIYIRPNPNLGMLATLQDSLATTVPVATPQKGKLSVLGLPWYWALLCAAVAVGFLWLLVYLIKRISGCVRAARLAYKQSEQYWFRKFLRTGPGSAAFLTRLYQWWDRLTFPGILPAVLPSLPAGDKAATAFSAYNEKFYEEGIADPVIARMLQQQLRRFRREALHWRSEKSCLPERQLPWE